jgi:SAM-dependent methyltransferase
MTGTAPQDYISAACEEDLREHGDSFRGVGYTKSPDEAQERYALMLEVIRERDTEITLLDLGCGLAHMLDHIERRPDLAGVRYAGRDVSIAYVEAARRRHPEADLDVADVLRSDANLGGYDYVVMNGLFNWRGDLSTRTMLRYCERMTRAAFAHAGRGIAFNVMSTIVDWRRDDLFHLPFNVLARSLAKNLSRHFVVRHDYEAYEYTTYVYRYPTKP